MLKETRSYCLSPIPILMTINDYIAMAIFLISIILIIVFIVRLIRNKIKKNIIFDKWNKIFCMWLITAIAYLTSFIIISPNINLYVGSIFLLTLFLLINLLIAKKFSLYKVRLIYWIVAVILFIGISIICFIKVPKGYEIWKENRESRIAFEEVLEKLPKPSIIEKEEKRTQSISYYIPQDGPELIDFYKSALSKTEWKFLEEKEENSSYGSYYKKENKNEWLSLGFSWSIFENGSSIKIQGRDYPFTYLTISLLKKKPCLPSDSDCNIPRIMTNIIELGSSCDEKSWY